MPFFAESPADLPDRETLLSMSGMEFMQAMLAGTMPQPTIAGLLNYRLESAGEGRASFRGTPEFRHTNPFGGVHGGWYGTVLDSVMGCAVMTTVPKGRWYTTLEFKVNISRALPVGMEIIAEGEIEHSGRSTAVSLGRIRGAEDGRLYATGSTTCIIMG
ncbi:PaaI family thioesterase [Cereibacter changlensis]|uniref:PaaI family thioesterase n=1 Tax=Cereibacter changlensis TaxID=402884 RepID=A0A4U0Z4K4_9RHOB|nr:PaaI family thioesterase [Cereibacter changlensis]TKA96423.1 PaaI family thioesterase [Cereibacter changlensis]